MSEIRNVAIVGAGTMGHSLAQAFSQGGCNVWVNDLREEILSRAKKMILSNLKTLVELKLLEEGQVSPILGRIQTTTQIEKAGQNAQFVLEAIIENVPAKKEMFATLDRVCPPQAILASNTSYLDIFKFVETRRPDKVLITHWFAPPHLVPLVEIVRGPNTSSETVETVKAIMIRLGKTPIVISKFLPGFIANRLQSALRLEAHSLLDQGYATPEDIDKATKASFGLRIPILGLMKREDYAGLDAIQKSLNNRSYQPPQMQGSSKTLDRLVAQGKFGIKTGSRF
jgi:3-hydroxybutyryl-CoA dehydrogenase